MMDLSVSWCIEMLKMFRLNHNRDTKDVLFVFILAINKLFSKSSSIYASLQSQWNTCKMHFVTNSLMFHFDEYLKIE